MTQRILNKEILSWEQSFMFAAILASKRSKYPCSQGACIVNDDNIIIGTGYTGTPKGVNELDEKGKVKNFSPEYLLEGEVNAILNRTQQNLKGSTIYVLWFPGYEAAKSIIQSGIKHVIYFGGMQENDEGIATARMFHKSGVEFHPFDDELEGVIDFDLYGDWNNGPTEERPEYVSDDEVPYLTWDEYFMGMAVLASLRSKDPSTRVGACIASQEYKIIGTGYNGFPRIERGNNDKVFPWTKSNDLLKNRNTYVIHAEENALWNANFFQVQGSALYVTLFPCVKCTSKVIQAGIKEVVYLSVRGKHYEESNNFLEEVGIKTRKFIPRMQYINF
ncbi:MAG: hypothetical protein LBO09_08275 [Candidatus Peribacteria bacterium]|jgi:dCMP deaminase|nr:hypothetical protein [Candidatus Peribacteria bacterium]